MSRKKQSRRPDGDGSLFKRESDGLWMGYVTVDSSDGKQKKIWVSSKKQATAKEKLDNLKDSLRRGTHVNRSSVTLKERIEHWLEHEMKPPAITEGTYEKYRINAVNHIYPTIGKKEIQKIKRTDMVEYLADKEKQLAGETVKILLSVLRRVFNLALIDEIISKSPLLMVKRTQRIEKKKNRVLTIEEETKILAVAKNRKYNRNKQAYNILVTEYGTGLRRSEILPLKKSDIDFATGELTVSRVYVMVKGKPKLEERAKSSASQDAIVLPAVLLAHLSMIETGNEPNDWFFPAKDGCPINPNSFRKTFKHILEVAEIDKEIRFHDLRHNFASQMVALDVHMNVIKSQMRHADIQTTSRYTHTTTDGQRSAAQAIDSRLAQVIANTKSIEKSTQKNSND